MKLLLPIVGIMGIMCAAAVIFFALDESGRDPRDVSVEKPVASIGSAILSLSARQTLPVHIRIPAIGVDAALEQVGLTPEGAMDVPKIPADAAWFDQGPRPGETGSAIIDGHYGWKDGIPAVFDDLSSLHAGDMIFVDGENGTTTAFVVRLIRTYGENEDAPNVFISNDGTAHLNLITCEGVWNATMQSYSGRLVVFADEETASDGRAWYTEGNLLPLINISTLNAL